MDDTVFEKYLLNLLMELLNDKDLPGLIVLVNI